MSIKERSFSELEPLKPSSKNRTNGSIVEKINGFNSENCNKMLKLEQGFFLFLNILTFFVYGLSLSAFGISVQEYRRNIQKDGRDMTMSELSIGVAVSSISGCASCLLSAWTLDKWNRQLQFSFLMVIYALVTVVYPLCGSYHVYIMNSVLAGAVISYINSIPSIWVVEIFQEKAKTYVQILHFFFPIGELSGPILVSPFLRNELKNETSLPPFLNLTSPLNLTYTTTLSPNETFTTTALPSNVNFTSTLLPNFNATDNVQTENNGFDFYGLFDVAKHSQLWKPYMVISSLKLFIGILAFTAYLIKPYKKPESIKNEIKGLVIDEKREPEAMVDQDSDIYEEAKKNISKNYLIIFSTFICLIIGIHLANEQNAYNYISSYILDTHSDVLTERTSSYGQGLLSLFITIGRLANIFLTMFVKIQHMIFINFLLVISGNLLMMLLGNYDMIYVWFSIVLMALGLSSLNPFLIAFVEERISLSNRLIALMSFSSYMFQTFLPLLIGQYLDSDRINFIILNIVITSIASILYIVLNFLESKRLGKFL